MNSQELASKGKSLSEDENTKLTGKSKCKVCSKSYEYLLKHLNKVEHCKGDYSVEELNNLKEMSKKKTALKNKLWKHEHKEWRAEYNSTYYEKNYDAIADKKKRKYTKEKEDKAKRNEKSNKEFDAKGSETNCKKDSDRDEIGNSKSALMIRKRTPINFTMADLENDDSGDDFEMSVEFNSDKKILPSRKCTKSVTYDLEEK